MSDSGKNPNAHPTVGRPRKTIAAAGVTILVFELLAVAMLRFGASVQAGLAALIVGTFVVLNCRRIVHAFRYAATTVTNGSRRFAAAVVRRAKNRRSYQFSLRTAFILTALVALVCGWYGHRLRRVQMEWSHLNGRWRLVQEDGSPVVVPGTGEVVLTIDRQHCAIDPFQQPKWIDFVSAQMATSKGIYRWEGARIRVSQSPPGLQRPDSFDEKTVFQPEPGARIRAAAGLSIYLLEPLPEP